MSTGMSVQGWVGTRAKIELNNNTIYYAMIVSVHDGVAYLSDVTHYSFKHTRDDPTYRWEMAKLGKLVVPLGAIRQFKPAGEEPQENGDTGLENPFFTPIIDPKPTFARLPWWRRILSALHF